MVTMQMKMALSLSLVRLELTTERDDIGSQKKKIHQGGAKIPKGVRNREAGRLLPWNFLITGLQEKIPGLGVGGC